MEHEPDKDRRRDARTGGLPRHEDARVPKRSHDARSATALVVRLLCPPMTVAEVAERLGYGEVASCSHAFKRRNRTPPSVYPPLLEHVG